MFRIIYIYILSCRVVLPFALQPHCQCMNAKEGVSVVAMAFNISKGIVTWWQFFSPKSRKEEKTMQNINK